MRIFTLVPSFIGIKSVVLIIYGRDDGSDSLLLRSFGLVFFYIVPTMYILKCFVIVTMIKNPGEGSRIFDASGTLAWPRIELMFSFVCIAKKQVQGEVVEETCHGFKLWP